MAKGMVNISKLLSSERIDKLEKGTLSLIMILGVLMLGISLAHIFWRYVLNSALTWSEELLRIMLVWFSLLSTTVISRKSEHIGIVVFRDKMPAKVKKFLLRFVRYLMLAACLLVTGVGTVFVTKALGQNTPSLGIPYSLAYAAIPVSFLIMSVYELFHIANGNFMDDVDNAA